MRFASEYTDIINRVRGLKNRKQNLKTQFTVPAQFNASAKRATYAAVWFTHPYRRVHHAKW